MPTRDEVMTHSAIQNIPRELRDLVLAVDRLTSAIERIEAVREDRVHGGYRLHRKPPPEESS